MNLAYQILEVSARRFPDHDALVGTWGALTYAELDDRAARVAASLVSAGVQPGDRVAFMMNNDPAVIAVFFGILRAGAAAVCVNVMLKPAELAYVLDDAGAVAIFCDEAVAPIVSAARKDAPSLRVVVVHAAAPPADTHSFASFLERKPLTVVVDRHPDDMAMLVYTSGTTGKPKGVVMSHFWFDYVTVGWVNTFRLTRADRMFVTSPFFYINGSVVTTLAALRIGATAVMMERFRAADALDIITTFKPTATCMVPTAVVQMLEAFDPSRHDVSSMRTFFTAGAPCAPEIKRRLTATFGWVEREIYGASEAHMLAAGVPGIPMRPGMIGVPGANVRLRLVDDAGHDVPDGEPGEILCTGDTLTSGYWRRPDETATAFRDGWYRTGDLGIRDQEGYLKLVGRKKEMIITGGANVYPAEVEKVLADHPKVAMAALIGVPDPRYGELPIAAVMLRAGQQASEEEIIEFCRERLAVYKCPRRVQFMPDLPLTVSGKLARAELRTRMLQSASASLSN